MSLTQDLEILRLAAPDLPSAWLSSTTMWWLEQNCLHLTAACAGASAQPVALTPIAAGTYTHCSACRATDEMAALVIETQELLCVLILLNEFVENASDRNHLWDRLWKRYLEARSVYNWLVSYQQHTHLYTETGLAEQITAAQQLCGHLWARTRHLSAETPAYLNFARSADLAQLAWESISQYVEEHITAEKFGRDINGLAVAWLEALRDQQDLDELQERVWHYNIPGRLFFGMEFDDDKQDALVGKIVERWHDELTQNWKAAIEGDWRIVRAKLPQATLTVYGSLQEVDFTDDIDTQAAMLLEITYPSQRIGDWVVLAVPLFLVAGLIADYDGEDLGDWPEGEDQEVLSIAAAFCDEPADENTTI